jgi:hypothetical protein
MKALAIVLLFAGCDTMIDPSGTFTGTATRTGETGRMVAGAPPDGTLRADTRRFSMSEPTTTITVRSLGETLTEVEIGEGCVLRFEHGAFINTSGGTATVVPGQECQLNVEGFPGAAAITGTAQIEDDGASIRLALDGEARRGEVDDADHGWGSWHYAFEGVRAAVP